MDVQSYLMQAFEEILDKMAYLYFEQPEEEADEEAEEPNFEFMTLITFEGAISGSLNLFFTRSSAEVIARNLVGIRDGDDLFDGTMEDAVCEFTNMVMGRTMTTLDPDHRFEMAVPKIVKDATPAPDGTASLDIAGTLDDEPCKLVIHYKEAAA